MGYVPPKIDYSDPYLKVPPVSQGWKCRYCGTQDNTGAECRNCAASRPDDSLMMADWQRELFQTISDIPSSRRPSERPIDRPEPDGISHQDYLNRPKPSFGSCLR